MRRNRWICGVLLGAWLLGGFALAAPEALVWLIGMEDRAWGRDLVSRQIEAMSGVSITPIYLGAAQKPHLEVLIASDAPPDLITWPRDAYQVAQLIRQGRVADLEALAAQTDIPFVEALGQELVAANRQPEGGLFVCPGAVSTQALAGEVLALELPCLLVRADLLPKDADFATPEGFLAALRGVRALEPDIIPLGLTAFEDTGCAALDRYLPQFLAMGPYGAYADLGTDSDYVAWLRAVSQAYAEGLLDHEVFTCDLNRIQENLAQGRYYAYLGDASAMALALQEAASRGYAYAVVSPPSSGAGVPARLMDHQVDYGLYATMISAQSKAQEAALRMLTQLLQPEGQALLYLGAKGSMWREEAGTPVLGEAATRMYETNVAHYRAVYGGYYQYPMLAQLDAAASWPRYPDVWLQEARAFVSAHTATDPDGRGNWLRVRYTMIKECYLIETAWGDVLPQLIGAETRAAFDQALAQFERQRLRDGFERIAQALGQGR